MTGQDLINAIKENHLEDSIIIPNDLLNGIDGEYLRFKIDDKECDYAAIWTKDDYFQDVVYIREGECTFGIYSKKERKFLENCQNYICENHEENGNKKW